MAAAHLQLVGIIIIIVLLFVVYFAATVYIMVNKFYQKVDNTRKTSRYLHFLESKSVPTP